MILLSQTVDNRGQDDGDAGGGEFFLLFLIMFGYYRLFVLSGGGNTIQRQNSKGEVKEGDGGAMQATPIEKLIHTKWAESKITFHQAVEPAKMNL